MLNLRFTLGAILATAVLAVSAFALYATVRMMQQANEGVRASSRTLPFAAAENWHRHDALGAAPGGAVDAAQEGAVSLLLNALPNKPQAPGASSVLMAEPPAQAQPLEPAPPGAAPAQSDRATAVESAPARPPQDEERPKGAPAPDAATGSIPMPPARQGDAPTSQRPATRVEHRRRVYVLPPIWYAPARRSPSGSNEW